MSRHFHLGFGGIGSLMIFASRHQIDDWLSSQKLLRKLEYAHSGEVKDDSAEESKADYSSRSYQGWPEWSVGWWRKRLHFRLSNVGQVAMPLAGRSALPHRSRPSR
jgi:hypothetical protein